MAPRDPNGAYLIFHHEKVGILDILRLLFSSRRLIDYEFVECSSTNASDLADFKGNWVIALMEAFLMALAAASGLLSFTGRAIEFLLNLPSANGGFLGLVRRLFTVSVAKPRRDSKEFRSIHAYMDRQIDLPSTFFKMDTHSDLEDRNILLLTIMAANKAYENEANIRDAVNNQWKMHFVESFNCWNKFHPKATTFAFIFCDKEKNAELICVAFRGTEAWADWQTDLDFSSISMGGEMGNVHVGFMTALGLQDKKDFANGFPAEPPMDDRDKPLAYYAIRGSLAKQLEAHPNASVLVTGHSLGGALAAVFPALLAFHGQTAILEKMRVITHAQPRVGDATFASFMRTKMRDRYVRTVYRYDIVPRVPATCLPNHFEHFGTCVYFKNWYEYQKVNEVPNPNYFHWKYYFCVHWSALEDLLRSIPLCEGPVLFFYRLFVGLHIPVVGPGFASHNTRNYLNGAEWAKESSKEKAQ